MLVGVVFLFAVIAYWPGLAGPWLFDDYERLRDALYVLENS